MEKLLQPPKIKDSAGLVTVPTAKLLEPPEILEILNLWGLEGSFLIEVNPPEVEIWFVKKRTIAQTRRKSRLQQYGIRLFERPETGDKRRPSPFCVQIRDEAGKVKTKCFATEDEQLEEAEKIANSNTYRKLVLSFDPVKWQRFLEFEKYIGGIENLRKVERLFEFEKSIGGIESLDRVEKFWKAHPGNNPLRRILSATPNELITEFLEDKAKEGISRDAIRHYRANLRRFGDFFEGGVHAQKIPFISHLEIEDFLYELRKPDGEPFSVVSKNVHRKDIRTFYNWLERKDYWTEGNPIKKTRKLTEPPRDVEILTGEETQKLFEANQEHPVIGRLALEAFAGIRNSTAAVLPLEEIKFDEQIINIPAGAIKTRRRFSVGGFPENLWEWLEAAHDDAWSATERQYLEQKRMAFVRADIRHPKNCLRHNFGTYHVALFGDVSKTATMLCHTDLKKLNQHYRGRASKKEGEAYFNIRPK